jgi:formylglycine-generating enzyme required for sulfatase activity
MRRFAMLLTLAAAAGCHSNPYCLNCGKAVTVNDLGLDGAFDLAAALDLTLPPADDLLGQGCTPTNNGVEKCDGLDNDCNGVIDDVAAATLAADPNNCGKCGNVCDFNAQHQFGACVVVAGTPTCQATSCVPGYFDVDPAKPGCEYQCTPTNLADGGVAVEICDGKDNDCNGKVDDPFGAPLYNSDPNNCGACGSVCSIPGAVSKCVPDASNGGKGRCAVDHCINDVGKNTYKHNPMTGDIDTVGCEYHCPNPSSTAGDCNAASNTCTFPVEKCNGVDDDCNFKKDDSPTDIGGMCGDSCPGGLVTNCVGRCKPGMIACTNGVKTCSGGMGPIAETCNGVDDDCNGLIDDPFTKIGSAGYNGTTPLYNSDPKNCGACGTVCNLPHTAINGCAPPASNPGTNVGICTVVQCAAGFNYVPDKLANGCPGTTPLRDGPTGVGCNYTCDATIPLGPEVCDGKDNDCNGAVDEDKIALPCYTQGMVRPDAAQFCAHVGVCAGQAALGRITASCQGVSGWTCSYSDTIPGVQKTGANLATFETLCDCLDNNCNGVTDTDGFPSKGSSCSVGSGPCKANGFIGCASSSTVGCRTNATCASSALQADTSKASDEKCNGVDDDCDGAIDEPTNGPGQCPNLGGPGTHTCLGYHDAMVQVGGIYVYAYEASRVDALSNSDPGGPTQGAANSRACSKASVLPWTGVTWSQAAAACALITNPANASQHGRLCTATEWTNACETGSAPTAPTVKYSLSTNATSYEGQICNDANQAGQPCRLNGDCSSGSCDTVRHTCRCTTDGNCNGAGGFTCQSGLCQSSTRGVWATGSNGLQSVASSRTCTTTSGLHDMSGNVMEWTGDSTTVFSKTYFKIRGGSYSSPASGTQFDGDSCEFSFDIAQDGFIFPDVGFRCCTDWAP